MPAHEYEKKELWLNMMSGGVAGASAAAFTNALESITVMKVTSPQANLIQIIQKEGVSLLTKGLAARVYYNGL